MLDLQSMVNRPFTEPPYHRRSPSAAAGRQPPGRSGPMGRSRAAVGPAGRAGREGPPAEPAGCAWSGSVRSRWPSCDAVPFTLWVQDGDPERVVQPKPCIMSHLQRLGGGRPHADPQRVGLCRGHPAGGRARSRAPCCGRCGRPAIEPSKPGPAGRSPAPRPARPRGPPPFRPNRAIRAFGRGSLFSIVPVAVELADVETIGAVRMSRMKATPIPSTAA